MSLTFRQFRSQPTLFLMSSSKLNHAYDTNQKMSIESKQSHPSINANPFSNAIHSHSHSQQTDNNNNNNNDSSTLTIHTYNNNNNNNPFPPHPTDKIHLKSTKCSSHHEVAADNWRIRYYMNLNLVRQSSSLLQYRSSSLPSESPTANCNTSTPTKARKSIERKQDTVAMKMAINAHQKHMEYAAKSQLELTKPANKSKKPHKNLHILRKTRSQNNTPPYHSRLRKHHKNKSRLSRMRSQSDGLFSFRTAKTSKNCNHRPEHGMNDNEQSDEEESESGDHHIVHHTITPLKSTQTISLNTCSSQTPPGNLYLQHSHSSHNILHPSPSHNRYKSDPTQVRRVRPVKVAIGGRSKPLSINKNKVKPHFNVDFNVTPTSYQVSSDMLFNNVTNTDCLVDDEANFEME